jgi:hypothetical protein
MTTTTRWPKEVHIPPLARRLRMINVASLQRRSDGTVIVNLDIENPTSLLVVDDANTMEEFEANARAAWCRAHDPTRHRGRPSEMGRIFGILWNHVLEGHVTEGLSQGQLIRLLRSKMGNDPLSDDSMKKYVKMWWILERHGLIVPDLSLPAPYAHYFTKHAPKMMQAISSYYRFQCSVNPSFKHTNRRGCIRRSEAFDDSLDVEQLFNVRVDTPDGYDREHALRVAILDFLPPEARLQMLQRLNASDISFSVLPSEI